MGTNAADDDFHCADGRRAMQRASCTVVSKSKKYPHLTRLIVFCAMASGIGFSVQESMYYFAVSSREVMDIWLLVIRTLTTALMHGITTAAFGIGLLLLNKRKNLIVPLIFGLFALCASIHALFNLILQTNFAFAAIIMPIAMFFAGWVFLRNREGVV
ncbi:MAG: PrsW family glutamic-type intramembrane protease [Oscillospiraceae bacterium]|nr:PrsW family glutamic-type intramembrane protease [Oscillospiraceae bacterium]